MRCEPGSSSTDAFLILHTLLSGPRTVCCVGAPRTAGGSCYTSDGPSVVSPFTLVTSYCFFELPVHSLCSLVKLGRLFLRLTCNRTFSLSTADVSELGHWGGGRRPGHCWALSSIPGLTHSTPGVLSPRAVTATDVPRHPPATPGDRMPSGCEPVLCNSPYCVSVISAFPVAGFSQLLVYLSALFLMCYYIEYFKVYCQIWLLL